MKKLIFIVLALGLAGQAWANNSKFYGLWQIEADCNIGGGTFTWGIGDVAYSSSSAVKWTGTMTLPWPTSEYLSSEHIYYTELDQNTGNSFSYTVQFADNLQINGGEVKVTTFIDTHFSGSDGDTIALYVKAENPTGGSSSFYRYSVLNLYFNNDYTAFSFQGQYVENQLVRDYTQNVTGVGKKIGYYLNGQWERDQNLQ